MKGYIHYSHKFIVKMPKFHSSFNTSLHLKHFISTSELLMNFIMKIKLICEKFFEDLVSSIAAAKLPGTCRCTVTFYTCTLHDQCTSGLRLSCKNHNQYPALSDCYNQTSWRYNPATMKICF